MGMFKSFRDKIAFSGIAVLLVGIGLLVFTFISAYGFLTQALSIITSESLARTFGEALAPLIATSIHIMYLGLMGWVGSLITIRGVTVIANAPKLEPMIVPQKAPVSQPQAQPAIQAPQPEKGKEKPKEVKPEPKPEAKPATPPEPQFIVIPPEKVISPAEDTPQAPVKQPHESSSGNRTVRVS